MRFFAAFLALVFASSAAFAQVEEPTLPAGTPGTAQPDAVAATQAAPAVAPVISCPTLTGRILDHNDQALVGATVAIKGTYDVFTTNSEGSYVVNVPVTGVQVLQISAGGYDGKTVRLQDCNSLTINLEPLPGTKIKQRGKMKGTIKKFGGLKPLKP